MTRPFAFTVLLAESVLLLAACGDTTGSTQAIALHVAPAAAVVLQGGSVAVEVTAEREGGFNGPIELVVNGLPNGVSVTLDTIVSGSTVGTLVFSAGANTFPQTAAISVSATGVGVRTTGASGELTIAARGGYTIRAETDTFYFTNASYDVDTKLALDGVSTIASRVSFVINADSRIDAAIDPSGDPARPALRIHVPAGLPNGDYDVTVTAVAAGLEPRRAHVTLRVNPPVPFLVLNEARPIDVRAVPGVSVTRALSVRRSALFTGDVDVAAVESPPGVAVHFTPSVSGDSVIATFDVQSGAPRGAYDIALRSVGNAQMRSSIHFEVTTPASVQFYSVLAQAGQVDKAAPVNPSVRVLDAKGAGVAGVPVDFNVVNGGRISGGHAITDAFGVASAGEWRLGQIVTMYALVAHAAGVSDSVRFTASAGPGAPAQILVIDGDAQSGKTGRLLHAPITVEVRDAFGNPVPHVILDYENAVGSGFLSDLASQLEYTDENGRYAVDWWLGASVGTQHATITAGPGAAVDITATALSCESANYSLGVERADVLTWLEACALTTGDYGDLYAFRLDSPRMLQVSQSLTGKASGRTVSSDGYLIENANDSIPSYLFLAPGMYSRAMTVPVANTGSYRFSLQPIGDDEQGILRGVDGCVRNYVVPGVTIRGSLDASDCANAVQHYDSWLLQGRPGISITVSVSSTEPVQLQVIGPVGAVLSAADPSTAPMVTLPISQSGYYRIQVGGTGGTVPYTVTIR